MKIVLLLLLLIAFTSAHAQSLKDIKKIYIDNLGGGENSDLIREKIRVNLLKSTRFTVVESPDDADAVLTGAASVSSGVSVNNGRGGTTYEGDGILRLVDKLGKVVWIYEYKRGWARPGASVSSRIATKTVKQLLKDAAKMDEKN